MLVFHSLKDLVDRGTRSAVAIGNFDGVHLGHAALLRAVRTSAKRHGVPSCALTFYPHPSDVLRAPSAVERLMTTEEKLGAFEAHGLDLVLVAKFDAALAALSAPDFFETYLKTGLGARAIHVGADFRFGKGRQGEVKMLADLCHRAGVELHLEAPVEIDGRRVSSTWIRELVRDGDVSLAAKCLGRPYQIRGHVVHGDSRGAKLGFPTANLRVPTEKQVPRNGVYVCTARWQRQEFRAVVNIGVRPTFENKSERTIEAHLLDFSAGLYDEDLELSFIARIRDEKKFDSVAALIEQIRLDVQIGRDIR